MTGATQAGAGQAGAGQAGAPVPAGAGDLVPVSLAQSRLLVLDALHPGSAQYNLCAAFHVSGPFDAEAFERALYAVAARHEALRTTFRTVDGVQFQVIAELARVDHRRLPAADAEAAAELVAAEAERPFDLAAGPLFRGVVIEVADGTHRLVVGMHHLVCDGWSLGVVLGEVSEAYRQLSAGQSADLGAPPPLQYADYAQWQHDRHVAGELDAAVRYWTDQLRGAPPFLRLPADRPRPAVRTPEGAWCRAVLAADTAAGLEAAARRARTTRFQALLAAFAVFLSRLSGQDEVVVGIPAAGRDHPDLEQVVGMLVGTLAVRCDLTGRPGFAAVLERIARRAGERLEYQDAPFEAVVQALAPPRDPARDPVFQVMFSLDDRAQLTRALTLPGARVAQIDFASAVTDADFSLRAETDGGRLILWFGYRTQLYTEATVAGWLADFQTLLAGLVADDGIRPVAEVPMAAADRRAAALAAAAGPALDLPAGQTAHGLVRDRARQAPDAVAVADRAGTTTYGELLARSEAFARTLVASGVRPGDVVGVCLARTARIATAVLGVMRAGGVFLPLEPEHPAARRAELAAEAGARLVVTEADIDRGDQYPDTPLPEVGERDLAYVIHTSGSTGRPKGVAVEHRSLVAQIAAMRHAVPLGPGDRVAQTASFGFDVALSDLFRCWDAGARLEIAEETERFGDPLAARLTASAVTAVDLMPAVLATLPGGPEAFPALRTVVVGNEAPPEDLARRWAAGGRRVLNAYGLTETTVTASVGDLRPGQPPRIGRPLAGTWIHVLDDALEPVPPGVVGELYIAGPILARGYLGRPATTADRFVPDPYGPDPGARMYRTGDLGRRTADGELELVGRADGQVKIRGHRIELGEVEAAVLACPGVAAAAVAARRDAGADARLVAYVVWGEADRRDPAARDERPAAAGHAERRAPGGHDERRLRAWLAERLPAHLVPAVFVTLDRLPTTPTGKTDRAALPAPPATRPDLGPAYAAPASPTERRLAAAWAAVLGLDRVGRDDSFFDLGGNSLRLLAVQSALARDGVQVGLIEMFRFPTVRALAEFVDAGAGPAAGPRPESATAPNAAAARRGTDRRRRLQALADGAASPAPSTPAAVERD